MTCPKCGRQMPHMSTVKWLESKIISETQRAEYAEGRVRALLLELDKKDAALRRAKAEGWREAARLSRMRAHDHALAISRADDVLHRGVEFAKQIEAERIAEAFDARAAQIEEGK